MPFGITQNERRQHAVQRNEDAEKFNKRSGGQELLFS